MYGKINNIVYKTALIIKITLYFQVIFLYIYLIAFKEDRAAVK